MQQDGTENDDRRITRGHQWFKYVAHGAIAEYEGRGWEVIDRMEDLHHGDYSVLMKWTGEGEPK